MQMQIDLRHVDATPEINAYWEVTLAVPTFDGPREIVRCFAYGPAHYHDEAREALTSSIAALDAAEDYIRGVKDTLNLMRRGGVDRTGLNPLQARRLAGQIDDEGEG